MGLWTIGSKLKSTESVSQSVKHSKEHITTWVEIKTDKQQVTNMQ